MAALTPGYLSSLSFRFFSPPRFPFSPPLSTGCTVSRFTREGRNISAFPPFSSFLFFTRLSFHCRQITPRFFDAPDKHISVGRWLVLLPDKFAGILENSILFNSLRALGEFSLRFLSFFFPSPPFSFSLKTQMRSRWGGGGGGGGEKVVAIARPGFHHRGRHKSGGRKTAAALLFSHYKLRKMAETGAPYERVETLGGRRFSELVRIIASI